MNKMMRFLVLTATRRDALHIIGSSAVALAVSGCLRSGNNGPSPIGRPVADIHCHVFNAADLPTDGWIRRVVFENYEQQECPSLLGLFDDLKEGLARLVVAILRTGAVSARDELAYLEGHRISEEPEPAPEDEIAIVRRAIGEVLAPLPPSEESAEDRAVREQLLEAMQREVGLVGILALDDAPETLAEPLYVSLDDIGRLIRWALLLIMPRRFIASRISALYPDAKLFTPALVDFSRWLDDPVDVDLEGQVLVMDQIQRRMDSPAMHCFIAFDPWRQVDEEDHGTNASLDLVERAIFAHGFIGVKLYPPMGFRPALNDDPREPLCFPARAFFVKGHFPKRIDHALASLFAWCVEHGVPILAHATNSNGSNAGFAERANPKFWEPVLASHNTLRLNLGHFGRFDEAVGDEIGETWEAKFGELVQTGGYPHVYADLSYLSELLRGRDLAERRSRVQRLLDVFVRRYPEAVDRLLYGSDWIMLGIEPRPGSIVREIEALLRDVGIAEAQIAGVMGGNAVRYLGLDEEGPARRRIAGFRGQHGLTMEPIDALLT